MFVDNRVGGKMRERGEMLVSSILLIPFQHYYQHISFSGLLKIEIVVFFDNPLSLCPSFPTFQ